MPYRQPDVILGIFGILAVVLLWIVGINVDSAAKRSPGFMGKLLTAGLALMAALGLITPATATEPVRATVSDGNTNSSDSLERFPQWKILMDTWIEAEEIASGKRGNFPFDEAGKARILEALKQAQTHIDALVKNKAIREEEGDLLKVDLQELTKGVEEKRPKELVQATCYEASYFNPGGESSARISARLPLLEKLLPSRLSAPVAAKVLAALQHDLDILSNPDTLAQMNESNRKAAQELLIRASDLCAKLREYATRTYHRGAENTEKK